MGTNFYWLNPDKVGISEDTPTRQHIGKRSAAGWYCWDCKVPLVRNGDINLVHTSLDMCVETCPKCGQEKTPQKLEESSAGIELGFAKPRKGQPIKGVSTCSSFSWGQEPTMVQAICDRYRDEQIIEDEYGREMTGNEFMSMVFANCPIQFTSSIGVDFS